MYSINLQWYVKLVLVNLNRMYIFQLVNFPSASAVASTIPSSVIKNSSVMSVMKRETVKKWNFTRQRLCNTT